MAPSRVNPRARRAAAAVPPTSEAKSKLHRNVVDAAYLRQPAHLRTRQARVDAGKALRATCARESHAGFKAEADRPDPIDLLIASSEGRIEHLIPIRYGRMLASPFAFFRGAAAIMACDLSNTPFTGLGVQACGDAHLANFGAFATPERRIVFDINDFDETFPAPWEWDLKRLAASFVIASRNNRHKPADCRAAAAAVVASYADKLRELAAMPTLDAWYSYLDYEQLIETTADLELKRRRKKVLDKALQRNSAAEFTNLGHIEGGQPRIKDAPPLIYHANDLQDPKFEARVRENIVRYRESLPVERRVLLDRYEAADVAIKVVGVGSVGTMCGIVLMFAAEHDPLFLQVKEARDSVLAPYVDYPAFTSNGERVVIGQRLMQAASDVFLGHLVDVSGKHLYVRQLRDVKVKPLIEIFTPQNMLDFARNTAWALARAHARSGDAAVIAGYVGKGAVFADAIAEFAVDYAEQNERDHAALVAAVRAGKVEIETE
jgi:uncharacterized protein (DUF2252 family)